MNKIVVLSAAFFCAVVHLSFCDERIDAKSWQNIGKFEPATLDKILGDHVGQLVAVKFNFRGKDVYHIKPNWYAGSVWQRNPAAKKGFSNVRVLFAKKDLTAFKSTTPDATSRAWLTLYGRVESDADNHFYFVRVLGRKATLDSAGNAVISW
jgi:hypothetical protein